MKTKPKRTLLQYGLSLVFLTSTLAYTEFKPNPVAIETSKGVKPRIMLILDNSASMIIASPTPTHATASWMTRAEMLYDSVLYLADQFAKDANFGITILSTQTKPIWPSILPKGEIINPLLFDVYTNENPDLIYNYVDPTYGYLSYQPNNVPPAYKNWKLQKMGSQSAGVIMNITDLEEPANMSKFKQNVREIGPSGTTPLGSSIIWVGYHFLYNLPEPRPVQYRCQTNHIIMFTDGAANAGDTPQIAAKIVWDANYLPTSGVDMANKSWQSNGMIKQNIAFHGIYFGSEKLGDIENPALTNLKDAAKYSNGMVANANSLDTLKSAFEKIINNIVTIRSGSGGTFGTEDPLHLTNENAKDIYYSTTFSFQDWTGTINAKTKDNNYLWSSINTIRFMNEAGTGTAGSQNTVFKTLKNASTVDITSTNAVTVDDIEWLKGKNILKLRMRSSPLSDIIGSKVSYSGKGLSLISGDLAENSSGTSGDINWKDYQDEKAKFYTSRVLFGSNDGLLNLINPKTGNRNYAFLPPSMLARIANVAARNYVHTFGIDGQITVADAGINGTPNTVAIAGYGAGGKGYFAVRLFCGLKNCGEKNRDKPEILWEAKDAALGYTYGNAHIVRTNNMPNHDILVANGYDAASMQSSLLRYSLAGKLQNEYVINTPEETPYLEGGGLSTPEIITDSKGILMYAYAGDLKGNLWKFDFTNGYSNNQVKIYKLFTDINNKPITTKPLIIKKGNNLMIIFGSGKYLEKTDRQGDNEKALHHVYGILDNNSNKFITKESLQAQKMISLKQENKFDVSSNDVDFKKQNGWYLPLVIDPNSPEGDRLIFDPTVSGTNNLVRFSLAAYANIITNDPCLPNDLNLNGKTLQLYSFSGGKPAGGEIAGDITAKPIGSIDIRNYDESGNILNISKITIEKPSHNAKPLNPEDPNSSGFGYILQSSKDEHGNDKAIYKSEGRGVDMDGRNVLITNTFNPLIDPCKIYPKACENNTAAVAQRIYLHNRF